MFTKFSLLSPYSGERLTFMIQFFLYQYIYVHRKRLESNADAREFCVAFEVAFDDCIGCLPLELSARMYNLSK